MYPKDWLSTVLPKVKIMINYCVQHVHILLNIIQSYTYVDIYTALGSHIVSIQKKDPL
jgi:hypothetical protein